MDEHGKFVSYAQNFEDVMLHRALKHVGRGRYVDIGASHPTFDSVSLAFHERGWSGLHVEPLPAHAEALRRERPGDTVLSVAVGERDGPLTLFEVGDGYGISTCDPALAERHRAGGFEVRELRVPCMRLSDIFDRHVEGEVHWLKIDVEGFEAEVIRSWRGSALRPWIVVVESTEPMLPTPSFASWEPSLLEFGYRFVYFDGLNRFYISERHPELAQAFICGPNYFDNFTVTRNSWLCPPAPPAPPPAVEPPAVAAEPAPSAFAAYWTLFNRHRPHYSQVKHALRRLLERAGMPARPAAAAAHEQPTVQDVPGVLPETVQSIYLALEQAARSPPPAPDGSRSA